MKGVAFIADSECHFVANLAVIDQPSLDFCLLSTAGTIRRFLEQHSTEVIVLCLEPHERGIYEVLAPLYFPRDHLEESSALWQLPKDIGGAYGEPLQLDRQIRIIHNPQHNAMLGCK